MTVIEQLATRFPQLYLKPEAGTSQTPLYRAIVRQGQSYKGTLDHFIGSDDDCFFTEKTPVGEVLVVLLANREDFSCFYQIMANRCEPKTVPPTMGASFLQGFVDWGKIHSHMDEYTAAGGTDYDGEFSRFTSDPKKFRGAMIMMTKGNYSAIPAEKTPFDKETWLRLSQEIRLHHELTHFVCRRRYPEYKQPIWDELLADCMGLVYAIGRYDPALARTFLGIENDTYQGGRLEIYDTEQPSSQLIETIIAATERLSQRCDALQSHGLTGYDLTLALEKEFTEGTYQDLLPIEPTP